MGVGRKIGELCTAQKKSLRKLAIEANVPYTTLYSAVKRDSGGMDASSLKRISEALNCKMSDLIPGARFSTQESRREIERKHGLAPGTLEGTQVAMPKAEKSSEDLHEALFWLYVMGRFAAYAEANGMASSEEVSMDLKPPTARTRENVKQLGEKWNIPCLVQEEIISVSRRSYQQLGGGVENVIMRLLLLPDEQFKIISELVDHLSRKEQ